MIQLSIDLSILLLLWILYDDDQWSNGFIFWYWWFIMIIVIIRIYIYIFDDQHLSWIVPLIIITRWPINFALWLVFLHIKRRTNLNCPWLSLEDLAIWWVDPIWMGCHQTNSGFNNVSRVVHRLSTSRNFQVWGQESLPFSCRIRFTATCEISS